MHVLEAFHQVPRNSGERRRLGLDHVVLEKATQRQDHSLRVHLSFSGEVISSSVGERRGRGEGRKSRGEEEQPGKQLHADCLVCLRVGGEKVSV